MRIIIRDPSYCKDFIRPHPNGLYQIYRLSYLGSGAPLTHAYGNGEPVTPQAVKETLTRLQEAMPLGILGEFEILCTGMQILASDDDPAAGHASGITQPGWIGLSATVDGSLEDILAHELAHALEAHLSECQREEFWALIGQEPGEDGPDVWWQQRASERLAEYLSAALWGTPIDERILAYNDPDPDEETLRRIREWAIPILGRCGPAHVTVGEQPRIVLEIGSTTALVDGREITLDVAPRIEQGRTLVPIRFIAEALGHRVDWEPKPGPVKQVLIY